MKLQVSKWGFKNFSSAVQTIEELCLERDLEKRLTFHAYFKNSPCHVAFKKREAERQAEREAEQEARLEAEQEQTNDEEHLQPEKKKRVLIKEGTGCDSTLVTPEGQIDNSSRKVELGSGVENAIASGTKSDYFSFSGGQPEQPSQEVSQCQK